ncbi:MAG TPA: metallophosphoesterase family protein [Bryobacteraceae bacterium]|nr:metallophosphoesterase family protein [Bryobacteraceae bacterium]
MRVAIVSDVHGNRTALEAVVADLRETSPDLILHGGDLPHGGSSPAEVADRIRDLGWTGVLGNTDEMMFRPESLTEFASRAPQLTTLWAAIAEMAAWTRDALGQQRIAWLAGLPQKLIREPLAMVHASPASCWLSPADAASDAELESVYGPLGQPVAVYGHIHRPFVRKIAGLTVANSGSVGLPYDGDRRAKYLLLDDREASIRRVEYDLDRELRTLRACGLPHSAWVARMLESAGPQMP